MSEGEQKALGEVRATISREIVRLQAEYYGKGPTKARTYIYDDLVVVVLEETFTRAEKTLAQRGEAEAIQHIRRRFQQQMAEDFVGVVEQATGPRSERSCRTRTSQRTSPSRRSCLPTTGRTCPASRAPERTRPDRYGRRRSIGRLLAPRRVAVSRDLARDTAVPGG